ncbi:MAG: 16S rRNA (uracil(1498)-N(3))-methyltransferase [Rhodospirillales bacterium]|nr:16S rRNA (uracil(1498)-N(3))-methyltransferase [Rhodospirillales bacterium]
MVASIPRLFVDAPLAAGAEIAATEAQAHYLVHVLRRAADSPLLLFNGQDGEFHARLLHAARGKARIGVEAQTRLQIAEPDLWLVFALLKRDATDLVVQKATELGAAALLPVITRHTNAERTNPARLTAIATEAAEQCERLSVPVLHAPQKLPELLAAWPAGRRIFAAVERRAAPAAPARHAGPAALLIGPEGGFAPAELDALHAHPLVTQMSLGPRILRAETAAIAGLALLLAAGAGTPDPS